MISRFSQRRSRKWVGWEIPVLIFTILPWIIVILIAHECVPGSIALTDKLFAAVLVVTYLGCWSLAIVGSSSPRLMVMRALATTFVIVASILVLDVPSMLNLVQWSGDENIVLGGEGLRNRLPSGQVPGLSP